MAFNEGKDVSGMKKKQKSLLDSSVNAMLSVLHSNEVRVDDVTRSEIADVLEKILSEKYICTFTVPEPVWDVVNGKNVFRFPGSDIMAIPRDGFANFDGDFDIIESYPDREVSRESEVSGKDVRAWLIDHVPYL